MTAAADYSAVETLRNGQRVEIRALRPQDRDEFVAAAGRLSAESLYRRFFAPKPHFSEKERAFFLDVDFVDHGFARRKNTDPRCEHGGVASPRRS